MDDGRGPKVSVKKVLWVSFLVDLLDVILGIWVTIISGSVVMLSQALEGVTDLASSGLLILGLSKSKKKANITHPFGYGRELYFWTLITALIMLSITSTLTFYFGLERFLHPEVLENTVIAYSVLLLTALTNGYALSLSISRLCQGRSMTKLWEHFNNSSLIETKTTFVLDLMGFSASVFGYIALILYAVTGNGIFDGLGAMVIGISLAILSVLLIISVKDFLIGKGVSLQSIETINQAVRRLKQVHSIQALKASHIGPEEILVNIEINAEDDLSTDELETLIDKVKDEIRKDLPAAKHIQVELES
jgi:cation diffusion facilitator family transporter